MNRMEIPPEGKTDGQLNRSRFEVSDGEFVLDWAVNTVDRRFCTVDVYHRHKFLLLDGVPKVLHTKMLNVPIKNVYKAFSIIIKKIRAQLSATSILLN